LNSTLKSLLFWIVLIGVGIMIWSFSAGWQRQPASISFTEFLQEVKEKQVYSVVITGNQITGKRNGQAGNAAEFRTYAPAQYERLANLLDEQGVKIEAREATTSPWASVLYSWAPILLMIGFWIFIMRQMQSGGNKALSFGKSRAKLSSSSQKKVTFKDVSGVDEAKEELQEIIEFLKEPQKFQKLGGRIPKGVLLMGPPGTGKTLLARAVAGEANVPFFSISGSDFVEMFVGVGASRVRDLFEQGKKNAPCIVFIDEIDAVGRHRGAGLGGGHDEREQTLNQLLVEMDGFESNEGVILVAATNRPDVLDPALLRPGRFDRRIVVNRPDVKGREGILAVHTKKIPLSDDVNIHVLARGTSGFSGADLANLVNEAALNAARYNQKVVRMLDFEFAKDKVLMGSERRSMIISEEEKKVTAVHEAGHALLAVVLPHADPVHKVTIIPRGMALGVTMQLPVDDKHNYTRDYLNDQIAILLGGRIAEEITMNGSMTTGAGNDLERSTELARKMVCEWGMSDAMGPLTFGKKEEQIFLGREIAQHQDYSEDTALRIDQEVKRFVTDNYGRAQALISEHKQRILDMADALLARETLDAEQVKRLCAGQATLCRSAARRARLCDGLNAERAARRQAGKGTADNGDRSADSTSARHTGVRAAEVKG
jgi:cell division protease FtsH